MISYDDYSKVEIKVGKIISAEQVENSEKLLRLEVDLVEGELRQVVSGIKKYFESPEDLVGKTCAFVTNLEPRKLMGLESQAMILAGIDEDNNFSLLETNEIKPGTKIS